MRPSRRWCERPVARFVRGSVACLRTRAAGFASALGVGLWVCGLITGCGIDRPLRIQVPPGVERPPNTAVILFVDGVQRDRMRKLAAAGELPNIRAHFMLGGVTVADAVSSLPSTTYPNASTIITGLFPSHHGIVGNWWYDPTTGVCREYVSWAHYRDVNRDLLAPTIFSILGDQFSVNVQGHTRAGATSSIENRPGFVLPYITGRPLAADVGISHGFDDLAAVARRAGRWPQVILAYYMGVDETGHRCGVESPEYDDALRNMDRIIGRTFEGFETADLLDRTYFILVSDHGMAPFEAGRRFSLVEWLETRRHLRVCHRPGGPVTAKDDAVVVVDGGRVATIHLRDVDDPVRWVTASPGLQALPATGLVAVRDIPGRVVLLSGTGRATVEYRDVDRGRQFRIASAAGRLLPSVSCYDAAGGWMDAEQWLGRTAATDMPDLVPQVAQLFDSPRTGTCVVFAARGWSLTRDYLSGHGSIYGAEMHVPMCFAGPGVPAGSTIAHARLVDVVPTVLGLLGEADRLRTIARIDGVNRSLEFGPVRRPGRSSPPN